MYNVWYVTLILIAPFHPFDVLKTFCFLFGWVIFLSLSSFLSLLSDLLSLVHRLLSWLV